MKGHRITERSLARTHMELAEERAAALGRIGGELEKSVRKLAELQRRTIRSAGPRHERLRRELRAARDQAELYLWYIMVQREAIGLRNHDELKRLYPLLFNDSPSAMAGKG